MRSDLTEKQRKFAHEYLKHGNAKQAAIAAGYSDKRAEQQGYMLLRHKKYKNLRDYMESLRAATKSDAVAELKELQEFWTSLVRGPKQGKEGEFVGDMKDRLKASELLGKCHGAFIERREHSGPGGGPIPTTPTRVELVAKVKDDNGAG